MIFFRDDSFCCMSASVFEVVEELLFDGDTPDAASVLFALLLFSTVLLSDVVVVVDVVAFDEIDGSLC